MKHFSKIASCQVADNAISSVALEALNLHIFIFNTSEVEQCLALFLHMGKHEAPRAK